MITTQPNDTPALAREFAIAENQLVNNWRARVAALAAQQRIALWGAGAKGVTFANLVDADCTQIACVVDMIHKSNISISLAAGTQLSIIASLRASAFRRRW